MLTSSLTIDNEDLSMERDHPLVGRYARIAEALLTGVSRPYHAADVSKLIQKWAWEQGLRFPTNRTKHLLSDRVSEYFPKSWLSSHFPATRRKVMGTFFHCIDHTYYRPMQACEFSSYLFALALIYETADEALNALANMPTPSIPHKVSNPRRQIIWSKANILGVWRKHLGDYRSIAKDLGMSYRHVNRKLIEVGLPAIMPYASELEKRTALNHFSASNEEFV